MSELQRLVWAGKLNLQIQLDPHLVLSDFKGSDEGPMHLLTVNIQVPRDSYLVLFLPHIVQKLERQLRMNLNDYYQGWWFEMENVCIPWNFPIGAVYDSLTGLNPQTRASNFERDRLNVWKLNLRHGKQPPSGFLPIHNGLEQIRELWMHQWKQACFVLNGNSKVVMSFSKPDTLSFWNSVLHRDLDSFTSIRQKILPAKNAAKSIPVRIHLALPDVRLVEPVCNAHDNQRELELQDLLAREFPEWFAIRENSLNLAMPVVQGIKVPINIPLWTLHQQLSSFDGFLHISLCLIAENDTE
ncbi:LAME_0F12618g1_1 [Lachancea meyersii CBS 8951]|uniref:Autophagy protein 5 n=1 Tax=Lachancea meyersii CBS 8951 TaxID=1266667 RepID=A0A1G4JWW1_9SACH|nr:LAME_0F12618g1_1 [Lachancea meyersii CBS 8951]